MSDLCRNCKRTIGEYTCFIPYEGHTELNEDLCEWKKHKEVLNADGSCVYYQHKKDIEKVASMIKSQYYKVCRILDSIQQFVKYQIVGRIKNGFDTRDCWGLNYSVAKYMLPRLKFFIKNKPMGHPSGLCDKKYVDDNNLEQYYNTPINDEWFSYDYSGEECYNAWMNILNAIYYSIEFNANEDEPKFSVNLVGGDEYEIDMDKLTERSKKVEEGFRLLGLFFQDLWD